MLLINKSKIDNFFVGFVISWLDSLVEFFELLLRLRQASIHPQLVINGFSRKFNTNFQKYNGRFK